MHLAYDDSRAFRGLCDRDVDGVVTKRPGTMNNINSSL